MGAPIRGAWTGTRTGSFFGSIRSSITSGTASPGAYYDRMFGTHLNPHVYETIKPTADHYHFDIGAEKWSDIRKGVTAQTSELGGGHAHIGCVIYNGGSWPQEYQGKLFTANLHGRRINMDILEREGCGFVGRHGADFMQCEDPWFRGLDLSTGPDGSVFVIDWSDAGECHDSDGVHRTSGRIYKISYGAPKKLEPFDLSRDERRGPGRSRRAPPRQQLVGPDDRHGPAGDRRMSVRSRARRMLPAPMASSGCASPAGCNACRLPRASPSPPRSRLTPRMRTIGSSR